MHPTRSKHKPPRAHLAAMGLPALSTLDTVYHPSSVAAPIIPTARYSAHLPPPQPPTEVIDRVYLSDISAAENLATLKSLGITHIVSAMPGHVAYPSGIPLHTIQIPLQDNPFAELAAHLPNTTGFIEEALSDPNARVLVHCIQGVSRSTSVVCAYLIARLGFEPGEAVRHVKERRSQANPNPGFVSQLGEYADSLRGSTRCH